MLRNQAMINIRCPDMPGASLQCHCSEWHSWWLVPDTKNKLKNKTWDDDDEENMNKKTMIMTIIR